MSVFTTDPRFHIDWANSALSPDTKALKPDSKVSLQFVNVKFMIVVSEFKAPKNHSSIESYLIKIGKQMHVSYNRLVLHGVPNPVVVVKLADVKVFKNFGQLRSISTILYYLHHLRNIAVNTLGMAEDSIVQLAQAIQKGPPLPPTSWPSSDKYTLARRRKSKP